MTLTLIIILSLLILYFTYLIFQMLQINKANVKITNDFLNNMKKVYAEHNKYIKEANNHLNQFSKLNRELSSVNSTFDKLDKAVSDNITNIKIIKDLIAGYKKSGIDVSKLEKEILEINKKIATLKK